MVFNIETAGLIVVVIWMILLTILFGQMLAHYNNLTRGVNSKTLKVVLENILKDLSGAQKNIEGLQSEVALLEKDGSLHIQKIGLLRFNPFKDTGGDQSFILALLNASDTGLVISGLYSRSGTRWYAKRVVLGKGQEYDLSEEEKKAIKEAKLTNEHEK